MRLALLILLPALCLVSLDGHSETNGGVHPNSPEKVVTIDFLNPERLDSFKKDIKIKRIKIVDGESVVFHLDGLNLNIYDVKVKPLKVVGEHSYGQALRLLMDFASGPGIGKALDSGQTGTGTEPVTIYKSGTPEPIPQKLDSDISRRLAKEFQDSYRSFLSKMEAFTGDINIITAGLSPLLDKSMISEKAVQDKIKNNINIAIAANKETSLLPLDWNTIQENLAQCWNKHSKGIESSFLEMTKVFDQFQEKKVAVTPDIRLRYADATEKYQKTVIAGGGEEAFKNAIKALREAKNLSFSHALEPLRAQGMGLKLVVSRTYTEAYTKNSKPIIDGIPDETYELPVYPAAGVSTWSLWASPQQVSVSVGYGYLGRGFDSKLGTTAPMILVSGLNRGGSASAWHGPSAGLAFNGGPALLLGYSWMIGNDTRIGLTPGIVLGKMNYLLPDDPSKRISYGGFLALTISLPSLKN